MFHAALLLIIAGAASEPVVTLSGAVVDANGKPVSGAMVVVAEGPPALKVVTVRAPLSAPKAPDVLAKGTSDESGKFDIAMPEEAPEIAWQRTRLTVWAYHPDFALGVRLIDRDWPRAGLPLPVSLPATARVKLKVTDGNYRPIADARIAPLRVAGHLVPEELAKRLGTGTGADGRATLAGIVPDELDTVRIESEALGVQWAGLPAGRDKVVLISLLPVGRLNGRLTADDPSALARRKVQFATWNMPGDEHSGGGLAEVVTDDDGRFEVPAIATGSLTFEIKEGLEARGLGLAKKSPAPAPSPQTPVPPAYLAEQTTGPAVEAGSKTTLEIPLRRAVQVVQEVRDEEGQAPIAGVRVWLRSGLPSGARGDTDVAGRLTVHVLPCAVWPMPTRIPADYYTPKGTLIPGAEVADTTEAVSLKVIELARGVPVRGRVVDGNNLPLAGAEIAGLWNPPRGLAATLHTWSNAEGEFTTNAIAPQMPVLLWARHRESTSVHSVTAQSGGEPVTLIVGKEPGVSLDGRVVDAAGQPIAGAIVRVAAQLLQSVNIRNNDLGYLLFAGNDRLITDADGRFHTPPSLRPNAAYSLDVNAPGMLPSETEAIEPGSWHTTHFADVVLRPAPRLRSISGRVVDRLGQPLAGAAVWQSGDGPRRTRSTADVDGRFQLGGIYDSPAYLFVRKDGYRLQGARIAADEKACTITLRRNDEPALVMETLPPLPSFKEQCDLTMSLVAPLVPMLSEPVFRQEHQDLLRIVARSDPARGLEIADKILTNPGFKSVARQSATLSLAFTDIEEALAVVPLVEVPWIGVETCVFACDELMDAPREHRTALLEAALVHARTEPDPGFKARELGRIAVRWLDLGDRDRGTALLREGQALAEALPGPNGQGGLFAGALARIDGPAALRLIDGYSGNQLNNYRCDVARGLADHDPVEAERLFRLIESPAAPFRMRLAPLARMTAAGSERAARLARTFIDPCERAFALGTVAHGLAAKDRGAAAGLLEEAYSFLDHAAQLGPTQYGRRDEALTAAALLPVAERLDPALVEGYLRRALSLRVPRPAAGDSARNQDARLADLAAMIARYDRGIARDLLTPQAARLRETLAEISTDSWSGKPFMRGLALTDPRWAAELVRSLPDTAAPPTKNPKQVASRLLAEWLSLLPRGFWGTWEEVYIHCHLRDFDTIEDVW